jgi:hypothetical protein
VDAQLQIGEDGASVVLAVYELPGGILGARRWVKLYPTRDDLCADAERLQILSAQNAGDLKRFPNDRAIPVLAASIPNPKETLRTFDFFPVTQEH